MIEAFRRIGEERLKEYKNLSEIHKKKSILNCLTNEVRETYSVKNGKDENKKDIFKSKPIFEIVINLDMKNDKIEILKGEDLRRSNRKKYFTFSSPGNGKKISFSSSTYNYHLEKTIPNLIKFIDEDLKDNSNFSEFKKYLEGIEEQFYVIDNNKKYLNLNKIENYDLNKKFEENISEIFDLNKKIFNDNFRVFHLYINGKSILDSSFKNDYINIKYLELIQKYFDNNWKKTKTLNKSKISHLSGNEEKITKEISILTKFYITDNAKPVFFENFDSENTYKAFTCSEVDYINILLGIKFIWENLRVRFKDLDCLLIPKSESFYNEMKDNSLSLKKELTNINKSDFNRELEVIDKINESQNQENFIFDMMFYKKGKSDFNIFKIISSLSLKNIEAIKEAMDLVEEINEDKNSVFRINLNRNDGKMIYLNQISLNGIWNSLYSYLIKKGGKDKVKLYRTEFFSYLDSVFNKWKINEKNYIKNSMKNLKYGYLNYMKNNYDLNNQILNIFNSLQFFENYKLIEYKKMENKKEIMIKEIGVKRLEDFFELHKSKFGLDVQNGCEKQGLIILGYLINKIVYAQGKKSKTFIDKINFDGIKLNKIKRLVSDVEEYLDIYKKKSASKIFLENNILSACYERLEYIEDSKLKPEEITYYILFGNSLGAYIGMESGKEKQDSSNEPDKMEDSENDN